MILKKIKINKKAFSLVEVLIVMFIAVVAFTSFYSVSTVGTKYIIESKNRLGAVAFANEKMEIVRNLEYNNIGTQGSIDIPGNILQEEDVVANGRSYHVSTSVRYFDDPMDGTVSTTPPDLIPNDYKLVRIVISWIDSNGQTQKVSSSSRFVPPGLETSVGGSPLSINVTDGETLLPISQATVHITNNTISPPIDDTIQTDSTGNVMLPVARISDGDHIVISKSGYETIQTLDSSPTFIPIYGHVSVVDGFLNTYNYFQNKLSDITVKTIDYNNNAVGGIDFSIGGGKIIGHDELGNSVFSMPNETGTTDSVTGEKKYSGISAGNYNILMSLNADYEFIDYDPSVTPAVIPSGSDVVYKLFVADKEINSLFLKVSSTDVPSLPIAGAKVTLTDGAIDIFTDRLTSLRGVLFYPDGTNTLENKAYTLTVEADGYVQTTQTVNIDKLTNIEINMVRI